MGDTGGSVNREWPESTLLGGLGTADRSALLALGTVVCYGDGQRIIVQAASNNQAYLLLNGVVKVAVRDDNGQSALLGIRVAGDLVGEMAALDGTERSADVTASGAVEARVIGAADLRNASKRHPEISIGIAKMISRRLRWANRRRLDFAARDPGVRIARVLYEVVRGYGERKATHWSLGVALTQPEIASLAGVRLRTAEKELRALQRDGVLVRRYRQIHVGDLDALQRRANG
jgi:CRP-like cAMP-binding protein